MSSIAENIEKANERIAAACERVGRDPADVELVAVSKKHPPAAVREAADCGQRIFGESRVQEALAKIPQCPGHLQWHLIGHLQSNKARQAARLFEVIHSVDSLKLLRALHTACEQDAQRLSIYIQVNVSGESAKYGFAPDDLRNALETAAALPRLDLLGLMTIPPAAEDVEKARPHFRRLRELRDQAGDEWGFPMDGLSMGMSHDFEIAVEEGATSVRLGTILFGRRS